MAESKDGVDKAEKKKDTTVVKLHLAVLTHYSTWHIEAAVLFAKLSGDIEGKKTSGYGISFQYKACVSAAIVSAFAFLEATINEFFGGEHYKAQRLSGEKPDPATIVIMSRLWKIGAFRNSSTFDKFQVALDIAQKEQFKKGSSLVANFNALRDLRNALVHFEPDWAPLSDEVEISNKLQKRLKGKFSLCPDLKGKANPFFPDKCMSYGCAKWAVRSSLAFADEFFQRMDLKPPYEGSRSRLKT